MLGSVRRSFHGRGVDFPALFKKRSEIKIKKKTNFSAESQKQH